MVKFEFLEYELPIILYKKAAVWAYLPHRLGPGSRDKGIKITNGC